MKEVSYNVVINPDGSWKVRDGVRDEVFKTFGNKDNPTVVEMSFMGKPKQRTDDQNKYYWAVVIPCVCGGFIMNGQDLRIGRNRDLMIVHEMLKDRFIPESDMVWFDRLGNKYANKEKSTTKLTPIAMQKYLKDIRDWCWEHLLVQIPLPNLDVGYTDKDGNYYEMKVEEFIRIVQALEKIN